MPAKMYPPLSNKLREYRTAKGLSLNGLACLTGIDRGTLSRVERFERELDNTSMVVIAKALDSDVQTIFFPSEEVETISV